MHSVALNPHCKLNCNLDPKGTMIEGTNIGSIGSRGDHSSAQSMVTVDCRQSTGCRVDCLGANACEGTAGVARASRFVVKSALGLLCGHESCRYGSFALTQGVGGRLVCGGEQSCLGADITMNAIEGVWCSGSRSCEFAEMLVINPQSGFKLHCSGPTAL